MIKLIFAFGLLALVFLAGCTQSAQVQPVVCNTPYILVGTSCCLDKDGNSVCDKDEETVMPAITSSEAIEAESLNSSDEAKKVALEFAKNWERRQFADLYDVFTPELKQLKTKEEFDFIMQLYEAESSVLSVRLDKVETVSNTLAYAYFTVQGSLLQEAKLQSIDIEKDSSGWHVDSFAVYFQTDLLEACKNQVVISRESCIVELAELKNDVSYCNSASCMMKECYDLFGTPFGEREKLLFCNNCPAEIDNSKSIANQPYKQYYNFRDCFSDVAFEYDDISICNDSKDVGYCYGNLATYYKNVGMCKNESLKYDVKRNCATQIAENGAFPSFSDMCVKEGFGDKLCSTVGHADTKNDFDNVIAYFEDYVWKTT